LLLALCSSLSLHAGEESFIEDYGSCFSNEEQRSRNKDYLFVIARGGKSFAECIVAFGSALFFVR